MQPDGNQILIFVAGVFLPFILANIALLPFRSVEVLRHTAKWNAYIVSLFARLLCLVGFAVLFQTSSFLIFFAGVMVELVAHTAYLIRRGRDEIALSEDGL